MHEDEKNGSIHKVINIILKDGSLKAHTCASARSLSLGLAVESSPMIKLQVCLKAQSMKTVTYLIIGIIIWCSP